MPELFKAKVRKVDSSLGILIPKEVIEKQKIKEGEEVEVRLLKQRKLEEVLRLIGTAKDTKPFERDRTDRVDRW
jgi:antitoxin component of MazEF toxin-antitoxin module